MYVLDTSLLSDVHFETIFSQFVSCFFILFMASFLEQKFYLLTKSYLSIFSFIDYGFGIISYLVVNNLKYNISNN